jgi:hypothetical protein
MRSAAEDRTIGSGPAVASPGAVVSALLLVELYERIIQAAGRVTVIDPLGYTSAASSRSSQVDGRQTRYPVAPELILDTHPFTRAMARSAVALAQHKEDS